jgi:large subunit ribosomal protein L4
MSNVKAFTAAGEAAADIVVDEAILVLDRGAQALKDAVVAIRNGMRAGTACTKGKGEVAGSNKKPWKQKGTGNARAGFRQSPVWRGGGVAHGPKPRDFSVKINRKVMKLALRRAFSERVVDNAVLVLDKVEFADHKTKNACAIQKNLKLEGLSVLALPAYEGYENVFTATSNIELFVADLAKSINVYDLLRYEKLVFTKEALDAFITRLN